MNQKPKSRMRRWIIALVVLVVVAGGAYFAATRMGFVSQTSASGGTPKAADLPTVASWLRYADATRRIVAENYAHLEGEARLNAAIEENVLVQLEHLMTLPSVAPALRRGELRLHGWVYRFETGDVLTYSPEENRYIEVEEELLPAIRPVRTSRLDPP